jgi:hypothetical protein
MTERRRSAAASFLIYAFSLSGAIAFAVLLWNDVYKRFSENNQAPMGRVLRVARTVQRQLSRRTIWERATADLPLYPGDKVRTGDGSAVRVSFESGDVIDLGSNSIITVEITKEHTGRIVLESGIVVPVVSTGGMVVQTTAGVAQPLDEGQVYTAVEAEPGGNTADGSTAGGDPGGGAADGFQAVEAALPESIFEEADAEEEAAPMLEAAVPLRQPENLKPEGTIGRAELVRGVVFSWDPVPGAERYEFILQTSAGLLLWNETVTTESRHIPDLSLFLNNRSLLWSVQAQGARDVRSSWSTVSLTVYLPPIDAPAPAAPERH